MPSDPGPVLTERLRLRPLEARDAAPTAQMMSAGISRWTGSWPPSVTPAEVAERIERHTREEADGLGVLRAIERRSDGALLGWIGVQKNAPDAPQAVLGYWLGEAFQRQGYAAEASQALMAWAWEPLGLRAIEAGAQLENAASIAVLRRLGMREVGVRTTHSTARGTDDACLYFEAARPS